MTGAGEGLSDRVAVDLDAVLVDDHHPVADVIQCTGQPGAGGAGLVEIGHRRRHRAVELVEQRVDTEGVPLRLCAVEAGEHPSQPAGDASTDHEGPALFRVVPSPSSPLAPDSTGLVPDSMWAGRSPVTIWYTRSPMLTAWSAMRS